MNITVSPCYTPTCTSGLFHPLGTIPTDPTLICKNALGDGMRLHAYLPFEPMPTIRFSYNVDGVIDCNKERAGRIGIMPPFTRTVPYMPPEVLYPVSYGKFQEADVFLVSTCDAKDLLLSTNNPDSRIKFLTTATLGTQTERMTILNNGNIGMATTSPVGQLQIGDYFTFHGGGSSILAHNAYFTSSGFKSIAGTTAPTEGPPKTLGSQDYPALFSMWNGSFAFYIPNDVSHSSNIPANGSITWRTAMQIGWSGNVGLGGAEWVNSRLYIKGEDHSSGHSALHVTDDNNASLLFVRNDGVVKVGNLAGTGNRPVYANASGELIDAGSVGSAGGWTLGGNAISTNSYFIGTTDEQSLVFKTNQATDNTKKMEIFPDGKVNIGKTYIGSTHTDHLLSVSGKIICNDLRVLPLSGNWPDYVFSASHKLISLEEVERYVKANHHLPGMPSAQDVEANGIEVGEMQRNILEKMEEMTLYMIDLKKENAELRIKINTINQLKTTNKEIK